MEQVKNANSPKDTKGQLKVLGSSNRSRTPSGDNKIHTSDSPKSTGNAEYNADFNTPKSSYK